MLESDPSVELKDVPSFETMVGGPSILGNTSNLDHQGTGIWAERHCDHKYEFDRQEIPYTWVVEVSMKDNIIPYGTKNVFTPTTDEWLKGWRDQDQTPTPIKGYRDRPNKTGLRLSGTAGMPLGFLATYDETIIPLRQNFPHHYLQGDSFWQQDCSGNFS